MKVKVVFTIHDTNIYNDTLNKYPVDMYIAISKTVYNVVNQYIPKEKIRLVYNGVDLEKFSGSRELREKIEKYLISHVLPVLCQKKKGQDILIEALNILKQKYVYDKFKCFLLDLQQSLNILMS